MYWDSASTVWKCVIIINGKDAGLPGKASIEILKIKNNL